MEHSLHLTAKSFVQTIALHCNKKTRTLDDGRDDGDSEANKMGVMLGKAITLLKQVIHSVALLTCTLMCM